MKTLSILWTVIRSSPKAMYYISVALYYLPTVLPILTKIREAYGSEAVQTVVKAVSDMIDQLSPPAPTANSTGTTPANLKQEKRRRLFRFLDRTKVASTMTDGEVNMACTAHGIKTFDTEMMA